MRSKPLRPMRTRTLHKNFPTFLQRWNEFKVTVVFPLGYSVQEEITLISLHSTVNLNLTVSVYLRKAEEAWEGAKRRGSQGTLH